jgi:hypothetical protein
LFGQTAALVGTVQHRGDEACQGGRVRHLHQGAGITQQPDMIGEVAGVRTDGDGAAETCRFLGILAAAGPDQAAPDEGDRGEAVP